MYFHHGDIFKLSKSQCPDLPIWIQYPKKALFIRVEKHGTNLTGKIINVSQQPIDADVLLTALLYGKPYFKQNSVSWHIVEGLTKKALIVPLAQPGTARLYMLDANNNINFFYTTPEQDQIAFHWLYNENALPSHFAKRRATKKEQERLAQQIEKLTDYQQILNDYKKARRYLKMNELLYKRAPTALVRLAQARLECCRAELAHLNIKNSLRLHSTGEAVDARAAIIPAAMFLPKQKVIYRHAISCYS